MSEISSLKNPLLHRKCTKSLSIPFRAVSSCGVHFLMVLSSQEFGFDPPKTRIMILLCYCLTPIHFYTYTFLTVQASYSPTNLQLSSSIRDELNNAHPFKTFWLEGGCMCKQEALCEGILIRFIDIHHLGGFYGREVSIASSYRVQLFKPRMAECKNYHLS